MSHLHTVPNRPTKLVLGPLSKEDPHVFIHINDEDSPVVGENVLFHSRTPLLSSSGALVVCHGCAKNQRSSELLHFSERCRGVP